MPTSQFVEEDHATQEDSRFEQFWTSRVEQVAREMRKLERIVGNPDSYTGMDWDRVAEDVAGFRWQLDRMARVAEKNRR